MNRDGIVHLAADSSTCYEFAEFITALHPNYILMKDVEYIRRAVQDADWRARPAGNQPRTCQQPAIGFGVLSAALVPFFYVLQLHPQYRRLYRIHAGIPSELRVQISLGTSMIPQSAHMVSSIVVITTLLSPVTITGLLLLLR